MKKRILLPLLCMICATTSLMAQDAKKILDDLSAKAKTYNSMQASFSYTMINEADGIDETQEGSIISQGEKYHLEIAGQKIISDGKTVWTVIEEAEEVQVNDVPEESEDMEEYISPTKILTLWEKGFKYKYDTQKTVNGKVNHVIDLFPEDPTDKSFHTIKLFVDKAKMEVNQIQIKGKDGTDFTYVIKEFKVNGTIPASTFSFSNPDYEVIDLR